jgi:stearoyl-CoA desaturase (delta-9 desaturase)
LVLDFLTAGELFQNNHHKFGMSPNFAARWFEIDPAFQVIRVFAWLGIVKLSTTQRMRWPAVVEAQVTTDVAESSAAE